jgi:hypothetical protein
MAKHCRHRNRTDLDLSDRDSSDRDSSDRDSSDRDSSDRDSSDKDSHKDKKNKKCCDKKCCDKKCCDKKNCDKKCCDKKNCDKKNCDKKCCGRTLYSIGAWSDNRVTKIEFIPQTGISIVWTSPITLIPSSPTNINHWNMQSPITQPSFPIFPLKINCGDKLNFTFENDLLTPNAFACAVNIDGIIYRTANSTNAFYPNKINFVVGSGFSIIDPSYSPTTDIITRNIVDTINYISVSPNTVSSYTLTWNL